MAYLNEKEGAAPPAEQEIDIALLESLVGYNLRRAAARQRERFRSVFGRYDIRPVQLTVLVLIRGNMPVRQSDLGRTLEMKRANVVTLLDDLIRRGLVVRRPAEDDRRSNMLTLTAHGISLTDELMALHSKLERELARRFGERELVRLVELLRAFRDLDPEPRLD